MKSETRICQNCKKEFVIEPEDFVFYEKITVPPPTWCPECRLIRKLIWRNERTFYKHICDLCQESIITMYPPSHPAPVYCHNCYFSDKWDPYFYGLTYDPKRPFFEQFSKLLIRVPKIATHIGTAGLQNINSEYVNFAGGNKNAYLLFNSTGNEDCSYSRGIIKSRDTVDTYFADQVELCYEGINVNKSSRIAWGQNVFDSLNSYFILNCVGVQNCFGCINLRHKSYHFFNKQLSKEEWTKKVLEILGSYKKIEETKKQFREFSLKFPQKENNTMKSVNCVGDYIFESKNCFDCFEAFVCEDCKYGFSIKFLKDSYDVVGRGVNSELLLETVAVGHGCSRVIGSWSVEASHDIEYSYDLRACENCLGCVGLKHAQYCILNRRYSEQEYKKIRNQIIDELREKGLYGLNLPLKFSPWAYNETIAQEYFPLTKEEAEKQGYSWKEPEERNYKIQIPNNKLPDNIKDVKDDIVGKIIQCAHTKIKKDGTLEPGCNEQCTTAFKIIPEELQFYRRINLPLPRLCPNCRHYQRIQQRNPLKLWQRKCQCTGNQSENGVYKNTIEHFHGDNPCPNEFETTYSPDRPEIVYCEKCYLSEVV